MKKGPIFKSGYYYLHINDQIIWKPSIVVEMDPEYFDSPFIVKHWKINNEKDYQNMIVEAKELIAGV